MRKVFCAGMLLSLVLSMFVFAGQATAVSVDDVTLNEEVADWVYDVVFGNDKKKLVNETVVGYGTGEFVELDKSDGDPSTVFDSWIFTLKADSGTAGNFLLSWTGGEVPIAFDFVFAVKASDRFALYLFDDVQITSTPSSYGGEYSVSFQNNGNNIPDLSHLSVYGRLGNIQPTSAIPEPATMLLFGTGLAGLAGGRRKLKM
jgi:hypothetical protein